MEPFLGQLITVPYNFAPRDWAFCTGQIMPIAQNAALFSLLGTTYGGNGQSTFGIPNLAGRVAVGAQGSSFTLGELGGASSVTLTNAQLPAHNHPATFTSTTQPAPVNVTVTGDISLPVTASGQLSAVAAAGQDNDPQSNWTVGAMTGTAKLYAPTTAGTAVPLAAISSTGTASGTLNNPASGNVTVPVSGNVAVGITGNSMPIAIMPPYIALNTVIALTGVFPSRS
ncbi:MAG TPA: tail fiber protein [Polyangiaceae bacterium]|nr:tail fiber protein [Polyangiaceae bacterium]